MPQDDGYMFTAFETSGDNIAAAIITELRKREPDVPIWAFGGPAMEAAGATLVEQTTEHAVMLGGGILSEIKSHSQRLKRFKNWLCNHRIRALVPVDSPAANWPYCKAVRKQVPNAKIVHLVAPQLWAWAEWRIRKLRRLTDHVLCVLPFEPEWFASRGVEGSFVGHPLLSQSQNNSEHTLADSEIKTDADWPTGSPRLALLPGSRASENFNNWAPMYETFQRLSRAHPGLCAIVAASDEQAARRIIAMKPGEKQKQKKVIDSNSAIKKPDHWPSNLHIKVSDSRNILEWCDVALVVSGTASLQAVGHHKPTSVIYRIPRRTWFIGNMLVNIRTFSLPNIISETSGAGRVIDEFIPQFGDVAPVVESLELLISDEVARQKQIDALKKLFAPFRNIQFAQVATDRLLQVVAGDL
jgi:lipid-A-disaccharide synthase